MLHGKKVFYCCDECECERETYFSKKYKKVEEDSFIIIIIAVMALLEPLIHLKLPLGNESKKTYAKENCFKVNYGYTELY